MSSKAYVIVSGDLPKGYAFVQGAHALAELVHLQNDDIKEWVEDHKTLVFSKVPNSEALDTVVAEIEELGLSHALFREPDLDNQLTAVACVAHITPSLVRKTKLI